MSLEIPKELKRKARSREQFAQIFSYAALTLIKKIGFLSRKLR
ncbi:hypothetical protein LEP1GSC158_5182 [Leptospira interrogans serovar Zanoni str. LT2156]|uniref:Uncharacterized protein n=1 Tax=Leptospira interrogans serovar Zanoni str. LT2156 TaxID=1001601 RepID=M6HET3_LEPIR|nr:hypothetical protein LEP1GSC158_5182 [Leptospira interrogans serovar Zanoni str. LT2156]